MTTMEYVFGIDVSKRKLDTALIHRGKLKSKVFENTPAGHRVMLRWLEDRGAVQSNTHICLEATGPYSEPVALAATESGWQVSVVNPARIEGFAQSELARNKNDQIDAALLARFCAALQPEVWTPPSPAWRELRGWVDRLEALKAMHQQESNRLEAHQINQESALIISVQQHLGWLAREIAELQRKINDHIDRHPDLKQDAELLHSIPGIGETTVTKILAYAGNIRRFTSAKALAAFAGLTPRQRISGSSVKGRTMLSRTGHADLRRALYMPGLVARRYNPTLKAFGDRLAATGMAPKAVVGAVMRKLAHLVYGIITSGKPFDENHQAGLAIQDGI